MDSAQCGPLEGGAALRHRGTSGAGPGSAKSAGLVGLLWGASEELRAASWQGVRGLLAIPVN